MCGYRDTQGNECSLIEMVIMEPDWAANRIREGEEAQEQLGDAIKELDEINQALAEIGRLEKPTTAMELIAIHKETSNEKEAIAILRDFYEAKRDVIAFGAMAFARPLSRCGEFLEKIDGEAMK